MKKQPWIFVAIFLGGALLGGCRAKTPLPGAQSGEPTDAPVFTTPIPMEKPPVSAPELVVTARATKAQFRVGEPVDLEIEVKNTLDKTQILKFNSGQRFDFSATREGETTAVWSWAMNKRFLQSLRSKELVPGESLQFSAKWQGAMPGRYTINALINANGGLQAEPFEVVAN